MLLLPLFLYSPSLTFSQASGVNYLTIASIMTFVCIFYTSLGGVKAVVWADVLQLTITVFTITVIIVMGVVSIGGIDNLYGSFHVSFNPDPTVRISFWTIMLGFSVTFCSVTCTSATDVQRYLSVSNNFRKRLIITCTVMVAAVKLMCVSLGLIMYGKYFDCDPKLNRDVEKEDQIVGHFITEMTSHIPGFNGLFVAALFGSSLSVFSTLLNTLSGIIYHDITPWFMPKKKFKPLTEVILMKIFVLIIGIVSIGLLYVLENAGTIFEMVYYLKGLSGGCVFGIYVLGLFVPFANVKGAFGGGITSVILMGVIIVNNQIYIRNGLIKHNPKPLHTFGCNNTVFNSTTPTTTLDERFWLFKISFQYYDLMGTVVTVLIGSIISWLTRSGSGSAVNPDHLSPIVRKYCDTYQFEADTRPHETKLLNGTETNGTNVDREI
ncbi:hypothetical protein RI129_008347 [Pyrocoelia pectoralis]|uniref:Sodium-coupled monocarboxylate transporter 1 n=1 Tax=Pyrocoelia pectoralis TaxID=417401 RepID=A0AAN7V586_9COLE